MAAGEVSRSYGKLVTTVKDGRCVLCGLLALFLASQPLLRLQRRACSAGDAVLSVGSCLLSKGFGRFSFLSQWLGKLLSFMIPLILQGKASTSKRCFLETHHCASAMMCLLTRYGVKKIGSISQCLIGWSTVLTSFFFF